MSKVLVDRELLELLRNFTFLHDDGCAGALRGNIDKALAAQPAEAEGVEVVAFMMRPDFYSPYVSITRDTYCTGAVDPLVRQSDHLAALSAVTAERDALAARLGEWERSKLAQIMRENVELTAERDRFREQCRIHDMLHGTKGRERVAALLAENEALRKAFGECIQSLHDEMLQSYGGQKPNDMHPVTRRNYDRDMAEIAEYRAAMAAKEA